ncbi:MAG: hypothetical protein Q8M16_09245 [Pirellulaceae bacterium]|nr:hypothetical protein [Pirellulaceae bacterium]
MLAIFISVLLINCAALNATLIVNGGFETGDRSVWSWTPQSAVTDAVVSFDVFGSDGPSLAFQVNVTDAIPNSGGSLSQSSVFYSAGTAYTVSCEQAMQNIGPYLEETGTIEVRIGGQLLHRWSQGALGANIFSGQQESKIFTPVIDDPCELSFLFFASKSRLRQFNGLHVC